jgi:hypothetical protein
VGNTGRNRWEGTLEVGEDAALTTAEWIAIEQAKDPHCACGCDKPIVIRPEHRSKGVPTYHPGHAKSPMEQVVDDIHAAGFLTALDVQHLLGCGTSQISRLIASGRLVPAGEWKVGGRTVRYFAPSPLAARS